MLVKQMWFLILVALAPSLKRGKLTSLYLDYLKSTLNDGRITLKPDYIGKRGAGIYTVNRTYQYYALYHSQYINSCVVFAFFISARLSLFNQKH